MNEVTKVWIAEKNYEYEGDTLLGVYSTKEKAIAKCQNDAIECYSNDIELEFVQITGYPTFVAESTYCDYTAYEVIVDEVES